MKKFTISLFILIGALACSAQNNVAFADMQQDVAALKSQLGQIKLELEDARRQNTALANKISQLEKSSSSSTEIAALRSEMSSKIEAVKSDILAHVKKELESMAKQMNAAIEKMAGAINARPSAPLPVTFSENFPKNGINYTIKSGDTLSKIASQHKSRVKWIQDANKIADANKGLRIGDTIFIPQE